MGAASRRRGFGLLAVAGWLATAAPLQASAVAGERAVPTRLTLRATTRVEGPRVLLADVVGEALPPQWARLPLAFSPRAGGTLELTAALVRRKLATDAPGAPPSLSGATACRVQRAEPAAGSDLVAIQGRMLHALARTPLPDGAVAQRFQLLTAPGVDLVGELTVQLAGPPPAVGSTAVRFQLTDRRGIAADLQPVVARMLCARAWVAAHDLAAGAQLVAQDVRADTVWVDTQQGWANLVRDSESLAGCRTTRALTAGAPLYRPDLRRAPVVQRGSRIAWIVRRGELLVTVRAIARSDGAIGDQVWIESPFDRSLRRLPVVGPAMVGDAPPKGREPSLLAAADVPVFDAEPTPKELP